MSYNAQDIFAQVFGVRVEKAYQPPTEERKPKIPTISYQGIQMVEDIEQAKEMSTLGTPILFPITFKEGSYMEYDVEGKIIQRKMGDFRLPMTAIADFRRAKITGKTRGVGGGGSVKELYDFDDWKVTIRGFCVAEPNHPQGKTTIQQQEEELLAWENLVDSIKVEGVFFQMRNIHRLNIIEMPIKTVRGKPSIRPFIIKAESDKPFELIL